MITINCDGGARGNPGPAACACVFTKEGKVMLKKSKFLGETTNNVAEYNAVLLALQETLASDFKEELVFVLDSQLVVNQLVQKFKIKNENLKKIFLQIKMLEKELNLKVLYTYVPREKNKVADYLVNKTLDENS